MNNAKNQNKETDALFLQNLISQSEEEGEAKELLIKIKDILPVLRQYNEDLKVGQNNIIKEQAGMENMKHWFEMLYDKLFDKYKVLYEKVDSINDHIDTVMEDAPNKLAVTVRVSEADYQAIQSMFDQQVQKMTELHWAQMQEMIDLHDKQMKKLNDRIDYDTMHQYERGNEHRSEVDRMLKDSDGLYLRGIWCWVGGIFFWIGVVIVLSYISIGVYNHYVVH